MAYEHKEGFGNLFKNKGKEKETQPDYKGEVMVGGKLLEIAGWMKTGPKGPYMSLKCQEPREKRESAPEKPTARGAHSLEDDRPW